MEFNERTVKAELEKLTCPEHDSHPVITIVNGKLSAETCCEELMTRVHSKINDLLGDDIRKETLGGFNSGLSS